MLNKMYRKNLLIKHLLLEQDGLCGICGKPLERDENDNLDAHVDHIFPTCLDGENRYHNQHLTHRKCNLSKKDKTSEYRQYLDAKKSRMKRWNVVLNKAGNFKTADFIIGAPPNPDKYKSRNR